MSEHACTHTHTASCFGRRLCSPPYHHRTHTATLRTHPARLTQGGLLLWNALTFFPLRRKVFKQMLLQEKKKDGSCLSGHCSPYPEFPQEKESEREHRKIQSWSLADHGSKGRGSKLGPPANPTAAPRWPAWPGPTEAGLSQTGEEGRVP